MDRHGNCAWASITVLYRKMSCVQCRMCIDGCGFGMYIIHSGLMESLDEGKTLCVCKGALPFCQSPHEKGPHSHVGLVSMQPTLHNNSLGAKKPFWMLKSKDSWPIRSKFAGLLLLYPIIQLDKKETSCPIRILSKHEPK